MRVSFPITAAGPYRSLTGFPFSPVGHHKASRLNFAVLINYSDPVVNVFLIKPPPHNKLDTLGLFSY